MGAKAAAGVGGFSLGQAIVVVGVWAAGLTVPADVLTALDVLVSSALGYLAVWLTPHA